ncbi:MAG: hypothetical protein HC809_12555, partial [Gammaproteobacteria bacterium]|nr:hypothetical protein [Gammaproteobacteria bacterium]
EPFAEKRAKLQLVLNEIAKKENTTADEVRMATEMSALMARFPDADPERTKYSLDGEIREVTKRVEVIKIRGKEDLLDTVRYTVWGPVVYDYEPEHPLRRLRLSVDYARPARPQQHERLHVSQCREELRRLPKGACRVRTTRLKISSSPPAPATSPSRCKANTPCERPNKAALCKTAADGRMRGIGFIPMDRVPAMKNPSRGFVFSANQHSTPPTYPYYYLSPSFDEYRGRHIYDRLSAMKNATPDSMKTMQLDNFSQRAADALPLMLRLLDHSRLDADGQKMVSDLAAWNFRYEADATAHFGGLNLSASQLRSVDRSS